MTVIAAVLRSGFVREDLIEPHIVAIHVVAEGPANCRRIGAKIARDRGNRDIENVVAESSSIRPATGDHSVAEPLLDLAYENIAAEN